jgi:hypothetical protein
LDKLEEQDVKAWEYVKKIPREDHCLASPNLRYGHDTSKSLAKVPCDKYRMRDDKAKQLRATPCGEIVFQIDDFKNHKRFITNL